MKRLLPFLALVLVTAVANHDALATMGQGFRAQARVLEQPLVAGQPVTVTIDVRFGGARVVESFLVESDGWDVGRLVAPDFVMQKYGDSTVLTVTATPRDPRSPLVLSAIVDGQDYRQLFSVRGPEGSPYLYQNNLPTTVALDAPAAPPYQPVDEGDTAYLDPELAAWVNTPENEVVTEGKAPRFIRVRGRFGYEDENGTYRGVDFMKINIYDDDGATGDDLLFSDYTDWYGNYDFTFLWDGTAEGEDHPDLYVQFVPDNAEVRLLTETDVFEAWVTSVNTDYTGTDWNVGSLQPSNPDRFTALHWFTHVRRAWRWYADEGWSSSLGKVTVKPKAANGADYLASVIRFGPSREWNEASAGHEYSHHWIEAYASPRSPQYCNGNCDTLNPTPPPTYTSCGHCFWCEENEEDAWNEGYPNWMADAYTRSHQGKYGYPTLNTRSQESLSTCGGSYDDPWKTEGHVGALLRDIEDSGSDTHGVYSGSDQLSWGNDEILEVVAAANPTKVAEFLEAFMDTHPTHQTAIRNTASNCGFADTEAPSQVPLGSFASSLPLDTWTTNDEVSVDWSEPDDVWTGISGYSVILSDPAAPADQTQDATSSSWLQSNLLSGEYWLSVIAQDRQGNWATTQAAYGPFKVLGSDGPDLEPTKYANWLYPGILRAENDASSTYAPASASLPGNTTGSYLTYRTQNTGGYTTVGTGYRLEHYIDDTLIRGINNPTTGAGVWRFAFNTGPYYSKGGRHTYSMVADVNNTEPELDETNNTYGRQWIWTPLDIYAGDQITRTAPPDRYAGHSRVQGQTTYDNSDGFRLNPSTDWWQVVSIHPTNTTADYDLRFHTLPTTGSESGFDVTNFTSTRSGGATDYLLINHNTVSPVIRDVGVINYDNETADFVIRSTTSGAGIVTLGDEFDVSLGQDEMLFLREFYTDPSEVGAGVAVLTVDPPQSGIALHYYNAANEVTSAPNATATTDANGRAVLNLTATTSGFGCVAVYRSPLQSRTPITATMKLVPPIEITMNYPAGVAASVMTRPDGLGDPLANAWTWDGIAGNDATRVDASFAAAVRNSLNSNLLSLDLSSVLLATNLGGLVPCPGGSDADGTVLGEYVFSDPVLGGGSTNPGLAEGTFVQVLDAPSVTFSGLSSLPIQFNSPDMNGDGTVNLADVVDFSEDLATSYDYASDFVWDGRIDLRDVAELAVSIGVGCGVAAKPELAGEPVDSSAGEMAVVLESEGALSKDGGRALTAQVVLRGSAAVTGIRGWEASLVSSDNVTLAGRTLGRDHLGMGRDREFVVGLGGMEVADAEPLVLATLHLTVTDDEPAWIGLEAASLQSAGREAPTVVDANGNAVAVAAAARTEIGKDDGDLQPQRPAFTLRNYPNPFNPSTVIEFTLPRAGKAEVRIYDVAGRVVRTLGGSNLPEGVHSLTWSGHDTNGSSVVSGSYYYRLVLDGQTVGNPARMTLLK